MSGAAFEPGIGKILDGRYRLDRVVGEGGFGVVYAGRHLVLDSPVALKFSRIEGSADASLAFLDEAKLLSRLRHPHIVRVLDAGLLPATESRPIQGWLAMEWCEGGTLGEHLDALRGRPLTVSAAWELLRPVIDAVAAAHEVGIVHRDLKPTNIMLVTEAGRPSPRLIDFGIAKHVDSQATDRRTLGKPGYTPSYAAPEQIAAMRTGPWTDVHALGLILVEALTGARAYGDEVEVATVLAEDRPTPASRGIDVGAWEPIVAKALALRVGTRHPNARALLEELERALSTEVAAPAAAGAVTALPSQSAPAPIARTAPRPDLGDGKERTLAELHSVASTGVVSAEWSSGAPQGRTTTMGFGLYPIDGLRLIIALHPRGAPSDADWGEWLKLLDWVGPVVGWDLARTPNLVITDGGAPNTEQRTQVNVRVAQSKSFPPVAVVTRSLVVRTIIRGFSIFNPLSRVFAPSDLALATTHLGLTPGRSSEVIALAQRLEAETLGAGAIVTLKEIARE